VHNNLKIYFFIVSSSPAWHTHFPIFTIFHTHFHIIDFLFLRRPGENQEKNPRNVRENNIRNKLSSFFVPDLSRDLSGVTVVKGQSSHLSPLSHLCHPVQCFNILEILLQLPSKRLSSRASRLVFSYAVLFLTSRRGFRFPSASDNLVFTSMFCSECVPSVFRLCSDCVKTPISIPTQVKTSLQ